jgi:hypothetical protein
MFFGQSTTDFAHYFSLTTWPGRLSPNLIPSASFANRSRARFVHFLASTA